MFTKAVCFSWKKSRMIATTICLGVIINWMKMGVSKNEYSEGVKKHGLTKNFGKFLFFDQKLWKFVGL